MNDFSAIFPQKISGAEPPSRIYDGECRDMNLSYEEIVDIIRTSNGEVSFSKLRPVVHEIFNFSDGSNSIQQIAQMIGYEYDIDLNPEFVHRFVSQMVKLNMISVSDN